MLEIEDIHVRYGRIAAVRGVSLSVRQGEMVTVVGPNGAGKSTTMLTIAGALTPASGAVRLHDISLVGRAPEHIARLGLSFVPERRHIFAQLTVEENLRIAADMRRDRKNIAGDFDHVLEYFPFLRGRLKSPGGKLSGGEQQQLAIARALMTRPQLILIDEPSLGLAPIIVDRVYEILRALREAGNTLVVVEQSTHRALENADRIYVMRNGRIVLHGQAKTLTDKDLESAYFGFDSDAGQQQIHF